MLRAEQVPLPFIILLFCYFVILIFCYIDFIGYVFINLFSFIGIFCYKTIHLSQEYD